MQAHGCCQGWQHLVGHSGDRLAIQLQALGLFGEHVPDVRRTFGADLNGRRARWTFDIMVSVDKNEWDEKAWAQHVAELEEQWKMRAAAQRDEFLRQHNLMYSGLIAIGIVMVQPFLTEAPDLSATICVVAFAVAIPILAALVLVNSQERYRGREATSRFVQLARQAAFGAGFIGVAAGF
jgi:hypothetical protein